jgi:RHS repeat-associated protein
MIWMDGMPVGVLTPSGSSEALSYIEPDQIGTPRVAISASTNAQVWTWSPLNDPFGETQPTGSITLNNRFPGQVYDLESGLSYNYFRDYDPTTGRYAESDPLGLNGGQISTYGYVAGNPIIYTDPLGLCAQPRKCPPAGHALSPSKYAAYGQAALRMQQSFAGSHDPYGLTPAAAQMLSLDQLSQFHRGGPFDAQAFGSSASYGNYVFGVYMAAAGFSLNDALWGANAYAATFAHYYPRPPMDDPYYPSLPNANIRNIAAGYNDQTNGILCLLSQ